MNEHQQNEQPAQNEPHVEYYSRRAARRQRLAERRAGRLGSSWVVGAVLILVGILIMFPNLNTFSLQNWWALFILIPAVGAFGNAWRAYQSNKRLSAAVRGSLIFRLIHRVSCLVRPSAHSRWQACPPVPSLVSSCAMRGAAMRRSVRTF